MINSTILSKKIINGRSLAEKILKLEKEKVIKILKKGLRRPCLCIIYVNLNKSNNIYILKKKKMAELIGINVIIYKLSKKIIEQKLLNLITKLNNNNKIDGILVQMPLPITINEQKIITSINIKKDVDCFHPENIGLLFFNCLNFSPCTGQAVLHLIKKSKINLKGANVVILGRSYMVGKPIALILLNAGATVTICHSFTENLFKITKTADILVSAVGKAFFLNKNNIKDNAIIIDVGINRLENGTLVGDIDTYKINDKVKAITPVPGGVGPMTIAILLKNTIKAYEKLRSNF